MKIKIIAILFSIVAAGCNNTPPNAVRANDGDEFQVIIVEGCQYLKYAHGNNFSITHKGNCNNPIHRNTK